MNFMTLPFRCLSIVGLSLAQAACDTPPTMVDQHFGLAVQRAQAQQSQLEPGRLQPMASELLQQKTDTDGVSALSAVTRYQQSFQTPPAPTPIFNIGLGAVTAP
jgi:hypothetical protein